MAADPMVADPVPPGGTGTVPASGVLPHPATRRATASAPVSGVIPHPATGGAGSAGTAGTGGTADAVVAAVAVRSDRGARIAAVAIAASWHLLINVPVITLGWSQYRSPWTAALGWLVYTGVGLHTGVRLLRGRPFAGWPLAGLLLVVEAVIFATIPGQLIFAPLNWAWGTIGWFAVLVLWGRRIRELIAVLAGSAGIALVAVLAADGSPAVDLSRYAMYVYGTAVLPIALAVGAGVLSRMAATAAGAAAARAGVEAEREAAAAAARERRDRLALVSRTAGAVLAELADGRADPGDPGVQRRCALAAARLRRLIAESDDVPDPLLHELRACADIAERNGLPVDLIAVGTPPPLPVTLRRRLVEPLAATLAGAGSWARLTVVAEPDEVVVSLVTPADAAAPAPEATTADPAGTGATTSDRHGAVEYTFERDEELVWVQTRWRAA